MPVLLTLSNASARSLGLTGRLSLIPSIFDNFNRADSTSLGQTSDGLALWVVLNGAFSISGNKAVPTTSGAASGLAVVDTGASNIEISSTVGEGGDAIYFRVVDANNWWRAGIANTSTTYPVYNTQWNYQNCWGTFTQSANGAYGCVDPSVHGSETHGCITESNFTGVTPTSPGPGGTHSHTIYYPCGLYHLDYQHTHGSTGWSLVSTQLVQVGSGTSTSYYIYLDKCVSGVVTQVSASSALSAVPTSMKVAANGSTINVQFNGGVTNVASATDSQHLTATRHGFGRREPGSTSYQNIDNWSCVAL